MKRAGDWTQNGDRMKYSAAPFLLTSVMAIAQSAAPLSLQSTIELSHVEGRIDHFAADLKGQRLFVSALGNHTLEVIDLKAGKVVRTLTGLQEPQGVLFEPDTNRLFVATDDGKTRIYDGGAFQLLHTISFRDDADNIRYDPRSRNAVVGYGSGALAFLDSNGKSAGEIGMDEHPESFQFERNGTRVFVNVPNRKEIEVADAVKRSALVRWPTTAAASCFPMALDESHQRLFTGCRVPARLLVYDLAGGKTVAIEAIAGDTDDLFYDAARGRIYVIGGEGFVDVLQQKDADHYERIARYPTHSGARTGLFVPEWGKLFVAAPHRGSQGAQILVYDAK